jgi:uncharacterized protein
MLLQVGPLQFDIDPMNAHAIERAASTEYAKKDVMNRRKVYEHTGENEDRYTVRGTLFPYKLGGLGALELAHTIREQGQAQMAVRGDGLVLGWFVITDITDAHEYLSPDGVGQKIDITLNMERADAPSQQDYFSGLMGLAP